MVSKVVKFGLISFACVLSVLLLLMFIAMISDAMRPYAPMKEMMGDTFLGVLCFPYILGISLISSFIYAAVSRFSHDMKLILIWKIVFFVAASMTVLHMLLSYTGHLMTYEGWFARGCESDNPPWNCP